jgi:hypothetical protein
MTQVKGINKLVEIILEPKPMLLELKVRFKKLECKTNIILILMHHMCISATNVSSVIVRPKNLEILNIMNVKIPHPTPDPEKR